MTSTRASSENTDGDLFIGGMRGFWKINSHSDTFIYYQSKRILRVMALYEDAQGKLWMGHENGLARYDPATNRFKHFSKTEGYPISSVYGILGDDKK